MEHRRTFALALMFAVLSTTLAFAAAAPAVAPIAGATDSSRGGLSLVIPSPGTGLEFLNLTATAAISFVPAELDVTPGAAVHLRILQAADFDHTFVLSSVANFTIPTSDTASDLTAFFNAHPPLVNLSLGAVAGTYHYANFTAPPAGSYEFVCLIATHFQSGMHGTLVSGASSSSSSSSPLLTPTELYVVVGVVVLIAVVLAAVLLRRRGTRTRPPAQSPPSA